MPADDGPPAWQRISVQVDLERREGEPGGPGRKVDIVEPVEPIEPVALPPVEVSDVQIEQQSLSFSVDQVGVPVVVKVSYFPNWEVSGALGPYRIGPNMMVVVPTANDVEMTYGRSGADWLFTLLTIVGIALCIVWRVRGDVRHAADVPVFGSAAVARPTSTAASDPPISSITTRGTHNASSRTASPTRTAGSDRDRYRRRPCPRHPTSSIHPRRPTPPNRRPSWVHPAGRRTNRNLPTIPPDSVDGRHVSTGSDRQGV